jgi:hypothetical protein
MNMNIASRAVLAVTLALALATGPSTAAPQAPPLSAAESDPV